MSQNSNNDMQEEKKQSEMEVEKKLESWSVSAKRILAALELYINAILKNPKKGIPYNQTWNGALFKQYKHNIKIFTKTKIPIAIWNYAKDLDENIYLNICKNVCIFIFF